MAHGQCCRCYLVACLDVCKVATLPLLLIKYGNLQGHSVNLIKSAHQYLSVNRIQYRVVMCPHVHPTTQTPRERS